MVVGKDGRQVPGPIQGLPQSLNPNVVADIPANASYDKRICELPREAGLSLAGETQLHNARLWEIARILQMTETELEARRCITDKWKKITNETCPARWHLREDEYGRTKGHTADPYDRQFADSVMAGTPQKATYALEDYLTWFHSGESDDGTNSEAQGIIVLFWGETIEKKTFEESHIYERLPASCAFWDLQKCLGLSRDIKLHNTANDAVAELLAFARILEMTESEPEEWRAGRSVHTAMDVQWTTYYGAYLEASHKDEYGRQKLYTARPHDCQFAYSEICQNALRRYEGFGTLYQQPSLRR
ncbi:hypothetical protein V8F33_009842 [Rhypophila sp. PSN 637]